MIPNRKIISEEIDNELRIKEEKIEWKENRLVRLNQNKINIRSEFETFLSEEKYKRRYVKLYTGEKIEAAAIVSLELKGLGYDVQFIKQMIKDNYYNETNNPTGGYYQRATLIVKW